MCDFTAAMKAVDSHSLVYADQINRTVRDLLRRGGFGDVGSRPDLAGIARCSGGNAASFAAAHRVG